MCRASNATEKRAKRDIWLRSLEGRFCNFFGIVEILTCPSQCSIKIFILLTAWQEICWWRSNCFTLVHIKPPSSTNARSFTYHYHQGSPLGFNELMKVGMPAGHFLLQRKENCDMGKYSFFLPLVRK